jgi:quinol monooxygenase YgiN
MRSYKSQNITKSKSNCPDSYNFNYEFFANTAMKQHISSPHLKESVEKNERGMAADRNWNC